MIDAFSGLAECDFNLSPSSIKKSRRTRSATRSLFDYFNLDVLSNLPMTGKGQMPVMNPVNPNIKLPNEMVAFDKAFTENRTDCITHFYTDDRRFLRVIRNPKKYLPFLKSCAAVVEPDLSQYINMPYPLRQAHAWLNRAVAAWWQSQGVTVIQNITWSLKDSYGYSLEGRASNTIVAVNCTGIVGHDISKHLWKQGYENVVLALHPTLILRYGDRMPGERTEISAYFDNPNFNILRNGSKW